MFVYTGIGGSRVMMKPLSWPRQALFRFLNNFRWENEVGAACSEGHLVVHRWKGEGFQEALTPIYLTA